MRWKIGVNFGEHPINRFLLEDLQVRLGTNDLFGWIEIEAEKLASKGLTSSGYIQFTSSLLQTRKIRGIYGDNVVGDACIKPSQGELYDIYYQQGLPLSKFRFSIAHEIGHTYWFSPGGGAKPLSPIQRKLGRDPSIEYLCNLFAEAILLPRAFILPIIDDLLRKDDSAEIPLHIIPKLSTKFKVAEQAVIRRLFSGRHSMLEAVICLRPNSRSGSSVESRSPYITRWVISWCSLLNNLSYDKELVSGSSIPFRRSGRTIPFSMIPEIAEGETTILYVDGRWWDGVKRIPAIEARIPFERLPPKQTHKAYAARIGERIYLALSAENSWE